MSWWELLAAPVSSWHSWGSLLILALALALDFALGDPHAWPHPVRGIGLALDKLAPPLLKMRRQCAAGAGAVILCAGGSYAVAGFLFLLPGLLGLVCGLYLAYAGLALGQLLREGERARRLIALDPQAGRAAVGGLVSRDVSGLDCDGLYRTLAESLSENFTDAFIAPLFWLVLGGPAGLWAYKAISTMDSMWGYKTPPWSRLGKFAARADDILAWIPARLSAVLLWLSSAVLGSPVRGSEFKEAMRQAERMESPNSGLSMAVAAWTHRRAMGGEAVYAGVVKQKPHLGPHGSPGADLPPWSGADMGALLANLRLAGFLGATALFLLAFALVRPSIAFNA